MWNDDVIVNELKRMAIGLVEDLGHELIRVERKANL
jgi:hypothetical protein